MSSWFFGFPGCLLCLSFVSDFVNLGIVSVSFSLDKGLSILLIFSKNQLFISLILCVVLFVSILLISALSLIISCHSLLLGMLSYFVLEFSGVLLSCLCKVSPISLWRHLELWSFLLVMLSLCPTSRGMICIHFHSTLKVIYS